ncbi:MAG TPA: ATP-binding cassette domain-containing protein, partial [Arenibaculum sp.]|nr:ATP-binding cassette domain-containing protein [Arenibaculum sp.]
ALPSPRGLLAVEQVAYQRRPAEPPILHRVSFELRPGSLCAILGPSGSGKSSLCRLLVGAWRPSHGTVRLDDADIARWQPDDLGRHIGYVPQGVELFAGTVARNIARLGDAPSEQIVEAARRAGAHEMILRLADGYDTDIGRFGERLSAGQRQRIALARALFGRPRLLVLDEPNANLDAESEEALARSLGALKAEGCTILVVTHRTGLLRVADRVGVMDGGTMRLFGPRDAVLAKLSAPGSVTPIRPAAKAVAGPDPVDRG